MKSNPFWTSEHNEAGLRRKPHVQHVSLRLVVLSPQSHANRGSRPDSLVCARAAVMLHLQGSALFCLFNLGARLLFCRKSEILFPGRVSWLLTEETAQRTRQKALDWDRAETRSRDSRIIQNIPECSTLMRKCFLYLMFCFVLFLNQHFWLSTVDFFKYIYFGERFILIES